MRIGFLSKFDRERIAFMRQHGFGSVELLVGPDEERGRDGAVRHHYQPVLAAQKIDHAGHQRGDIGFHGRIVEEVEVKLPAERDQSMRSRLEFFEATRKVRERLLAMHAMSVDTGN